MLYSADFETTVDPNDCRVWAWGVCEINDGYKYKYGNNVDDFFSFMEHSGNSTFYFHNLKFDGEFIFVWLFEHGFKHVIERKDRASKTFTTIISDKGQFYCIEIIFEMKNKNVKKATIYDSLKILPFSVDQVAKAFALPIGKLTLDYATYREPGHVLTPHEVEYLRGDVEVMARALKIMFDQGLTKMTQGANALYDYKTITGKRNFERWFPTPDYDADVRQSYKGGFTYLNPKYKGINVGTGLVFDVNSLYPWVMHDCLLPYGDPIYFEGEYEYDELYPLYVQMLSCQFELKPGRIPSIQIKGGYSFCPTEYLESSGDEIVTICLTSVDLKLFFEQYEVYNPEFHSGWKFKATSGLFSEYIDKWTAIKIEASKSGNKAMRTLAKLMLNSLYGKFGLNPVVMSKYPYYNEGKIGYTKSEPNYRTPLYIPVATFVTAWARHKTITSAQQVYDHFVYADTDSLHLSIELPP